MSERQLLSRLEADLPSSAPRKGRGHVVGRADRTDVGLPAVEDQKTCPDCAESVKVLARVCRFCGHHFDESQAEAVPAPADSRSDLDSCGCISWIVTLLIIGAVLHFAFGFPNGDSGSGIKGSSSSTAARSDQPDEAILRNATCSDVKSKGKTDAPLLDPVANYIADRIEVVGKTHDEIRKAVVYSILFDCVIDKPSEPVDSVGLRYNVRQLLTLGKQPSP